GGAELVREALHRELAGGDLGGVHRAGRSDDGGGAGFERRFRTGDGNPGGAGGSDGAGCEKEDEAPGGHTEFLPRSSGCARARALCGVFFWGAPRPFRAATLYRGAAAPPFHPPSAAPRAAKRELQPERSRSGPGSRRFWSSFSFGSGPSFSFLFSLSPQLIDSMMTETP